MSDDDKGLPYGTLTRCIHATEDDAKRKERMKRADERVQAWSDWQPVSEAEAHAQLRALRYVLRVVQESHCPQATPTTRAQRQVNEEMELGRLQVIDEIEALVRHLEENWP